MSNPVTFGIEVELSGISQETAARALTRIGVKNQVVNRATESVPSGYWKIAPDGSINSRSGEEAELVSPILDIRTLASIPRILKAVKEVGADANRSCGIHIHLGADTMGLDNLYARGRFVYNWHSLHFYLTMVTSPSRVYNRYCKPVTRQYALIEKKGMEQGADYSPQHTSGCGCGTYCDYRYTSINTAALKKHKTLEMRIFNGSTDGETILSWVKLVEAIAKASVAGVVFENIQDELGISTFRALDGWSEAEIYIQGMKNIISYLVDNGFLIPAVADRLYKRLNRMPKLIAANPESPSCSVQITRDEYEARRSR